MAAFPVIVPVSPVAITTSSPALTYTQLLTTLLFISYKITSIYIQASNNAQLTKDFMLTKGKPNGEQTKEYASVVVDPGQYQPIAILNPGEDFVLDNMTTLDFQLNPNEVVDLYFIADTVSASYDLNQPAVPVQGTQNKIAAPVVKDNSQRNLLIAAAAIAGALYILNKHG